MLFERGGVFGDRAVVVLSLLGTLAGTEGGGSGASLEGDRERQGGRDSASCVSHQ